MVIFNIIAKAFDSVSFEALQTVLRSKGIPNSFSNYIMNFLTSSPLFLEHGGWSTKDIQPTLGLRQGDPLSPTLFNLTIDLLLKQIPEEIGVDVDGLRLSVMTFADDLVLVASSSVGLQTLIHNLTNFLSQCGLSVNTNKCSTITYKTIPKLKKLAVDAKSKFSINNKDLIALKRTDEWRYLGIPFTAESRAKINIKEKVAEQIALVSKAPLKPQPPL